MPIDITQAPKTQRSAKDGGVRESSLPDRRPRDNLYPRGFLDLTLTIAPPRT